MSTLTRHPTVRELVTDRTRLAAAAYLALAGGANLAAGTWLYANASADWLVRWLIGTFVGSYGELGGLARGGTVDLLTTQVLPALAAALLVIGAVCLVGARAAYRGRGWRRATAAGVVGSLNPVALPLGAVAVALLVLSRGRFDDSPADDGAA